MPRRTVASNSASASISATSSSRATTSIGDGVNVAARIEALAELAGCASPSTVHDQVRDKLSFVFEDMGEQRVKNIARPVRVYRVRDLAAAKTPGPPALRLPDKPSIAVLPFANMSGDPE